MSFDDKNGRGLGTVYIHVIFLNGTQRVPPRGCLRPLGFSLSSGCTRQADLRERIASVEYRPTS